MQQISPAQCTIQEYLPASSLLENSPAMMYKIINSFCLGLCLSNAVMQGSHLFALQAGQHISYCHSSIEFAAGDIVAEHLFAGKLVRVHEVFQKSLKLTACSYLFKPPACILRLASKQWIFQYFASKLVEHVDEVLQGRWYGSQISSAITSKDLQSFPILTSRGCADAEPSFAAEPLMCCACKAAIWSWPWNPTPVIACRPRSCADRPLTAFSTLSMPCLYFKSSRKKPAQTTSKSETDGSAALSNSGQSALSSAR